MTSTQKRGGGVLKFVTCLQVLLFLDLFFTFADRGGGGSGLGVIKLVIFSMAFIAITFVKMITFIIITAFRIYRYLI